MINASRSYKNTINKKLINIKRTVETLLNKCEQQILSVPVRT